MASNRSKKTEQTKRTGQKATGSSGKSTTNTRKPTAKKVATEEVASLINTFDYKIPLNEQKFYSVVAPRFNALKDGLLQIISQDALLCSKIKSMHLVICDNRKSKGRMLFMITDTVKSSCYLFDEYQNARGFHGFGSTDFSMGTCSDMQLIEGLRSVFVEVLLLRTKPEDLANYIERFLRSNYRGIFIEHTELFYRFGVANLQFSESVFSISAYRLNMVIPIVAELAAGQVSDSTSGNKKILLTTSKDTSRYTDFECVIGFDQFHSYFDNFSFIDNSNFFNKLARLDTNHLYEALKYLRTTLTIEYFELKRRLATVEISDGKSFENILKDILSRCFKPCYEELHLNTQVNNRGRTTIRDFIIRNNGSYHPFLKKLENRGVELLLFDAKNYGGKLTSRDLSTFRTYLMDNRAFGNFGIILSRNGISSNAKETLFRSSLSKEAIVILVLDENDLISLLNKVEQKRSAADVLAEKYFDFLTQA